MGFITYVSHFLLPQQGVTSVLQTPRSYTKMNEIYLRSKCKAIRDCKATLRHLREILERQCKIKIIQMVYLRRMHISFFCLNPLLL